MSELKVEVEGGKAYQIESLGKSQFKVDGKEVELDIEVLGQGKFHILRNHQSYTAEVIQSNAEEKSFDIKVNQNIYSLKVEDRFDLLLQQLGMDNLNSNAVSDLKAPMPGLVLSIEVSPGQAVKKDEPLLILEAMKMENALKCPADLVVKSIAVEQGQAVEKNQLLIEFES